MPLLTAEQLHDLRRIIEDAATALAVTTFGDEVPEELIQHLVDEGWIDPATAENLSLSAFTFGQLLARLPSAAEMSPAAFRAEVERNPVALSAEEREAVAIATQRAGQFCRGLGNRYSEELGRVVVNADAELAQTLREGIQDETGTALAQREGRKTLVRRLRQMSADFTRDWDRIAQTETHMAREEGFFEATVGREGDAVRMAKVPEADACDACKRAYLDEDGKPLVMPASWWHANGSNNVGRKKAEWLPVLGAMHPWCRCALVEVPANWEFDDQGSLVPSEIEEEEIEKSGATETPQAIMAQGMRRAGWGPIPKGKHGGFRRRTRGGWEYWYPEKGHAPAPLAHQGRTLEDAVKRRAEHGIPIVVSWGVGLDSTAVLVGMKQRGIRPDKILFADVGGENPATYAFLGIANEWLKKVGFPEVTVVRLKPGKSRQTGESYATLEDQCRKLGTLPSLAFGGRGCSQKWKHGPQEQHDNNWQVARDTWERGFKVTKLIGYSADYADRRRPDVADDDKYHYVYPLREWGWDRARSEHEIKAAGMPVPTKSSCWFCPAVKPEELRAIVKDNPDIARRIIRMEATASPKLTKIRGLWTRDTQGKRGATKKPGLMTEWIVGEELLPEFRGQKIVDPWWRRDDGKPSNSEFRAEHVVDLLQDTGEIPVSPLEKLSGLVPSVIEKLATKSPKTSQLDLIKGESEEDAIERALAVVQAYDQIEFAEAPIEKSLYKPHRLIKARVLAGQLGLFGDKPAPAAAPKGGPFIGPRGGKWADPEHTVHWEDVVGNAPAEPKEREWKGQKMSPPTEEIHEYAAHAHRAMAGAVSTWTHEPSKGKQAIFDAHGKLDEIEQAALQFQVQDIVERDTGGEHVTAYRVLNEGDDPKKMGGASVSLDPRWKEKPNAQAFKVHYSDILLHHKQANIPGNKHRGSELGLGYGHEQEVILRPDAKPEHLGPAAAPEPEPKVGGHVEVQPHERTFHAAAQQGPIKFHIQARKNGKVKVSRHSTDPEGYGTWMPEESLRHFKNDLEGRVDLPEHGRAEIDAVVTGKAEFLGKGDDGLAFRVGDKVVKVSTTVPYQPENPGHRTPQGAADMLRKQVEVGNKLADLGVPCVQRSEFVQHGDKGFQIKPWVKIPEKLTREQLEKVQAAVIKMHDAGYTLNDEPQVGLDAKGEPVMFDIGKADKREQTGGERERYGWDGWATHDMDGLKRLYKQHGQEFVRQGLSEADEHWEHTKNQIESLRDPKKKLDAAHVAIARRELDRSTAKRKREAEAKGDKAALETIDFDHEDALADIAAAEHRLGAETAALAQRAAELEGEIQKALPAGTTHTWADGRRYQKQDDGSWLPVAGEAAPPKRTGAIKVDPAAVRALVDKFLSDQPWNRFGVLVADLGTRTDAVRAETARGEKLNVMVTVQQKPDVHDDRGVSGRHQLAVSADGFRRNTITLNVRRGVGMAGGWDRDRLAETLRSVLSHELAHAADPTIYEHSMQQLRAGKLTTADPGVRDYGGGSDLEARTRAYYNAADEVTARMQQIWRELTDRRAVAAIDQIRRESREEGAVFEPSAASHLGMSETWNRIEEHLTPENRKRILRMAARAWQSIQSGNVDPAFEKSRKLEGRRRFAGFDVSIENDVDSVRHWHDKETGKDGTVTMSVPYGYIRRTEGVDGDHVDVFLGPHEDATEVYVIHQRKAPAFKDYDEDKVMLGWKDKASAVSAYLQHYDDPRFLGPVTTLPLEEFRRKVHATLEHPAMVKGGPYIGPRGGKWADAAHTIHWEPEQPKGAPQLDLFEALATKASKPEAWGLPAGARVDPWEPPPIDPEAEWSHPDYGSGKGAAPWQHGPDWHPDLKSYDYLVVNTSSGKDSQAMLDRVVKLAEEQGILKSKIVVVHADLGRVEWAGSRELAQKQAEHYGLRFEVVKRQQNDLLNQIEARHGDLVQKEADTGAMLGAGIKTWADLAAADPERLASIIGTGQGVSQWPGSDRARKLILKAKATIKGDPEAPEAPISFGKAVAWPSSSARYCTSDHKRAEIKKLITALAAEHKKAGKGKARILNMLGIRAQESGAPTQPGKFATSGRAAMPSFSREEDTRTKTVDRWYPIHRWPEQRVWKTIEASGTPYHRAYDLGMRRLSCCFCVFAPKEDLMIAAKHNPELFAEYLRLEQKVGASFKANESLAEVQAEIVRRRSAGFDLSDVGEWVKKALGLDLPDAMIKADLERDPPGVLLMLEAGRYRLRALGASPETVQLEWKASGACIHLDGNHVLFVPYPQAYNASMVAAVFAESHRLPFEEHNVPAAVGTGVVAARPQLELFKAAEFSGYGGAGGRASGSGVGTMGNWGDPARTPGDNVMDPNPVDGYLFVPPKQRKKRKRTREPEGGRPSTPTTLQDASERFDMGGVGFRSGGGWANPPDYEMLEATTPNLPSPREKASGVPDHPNAVSGKQYRETLENYTRERIVLRDSGRIQVIPPRIPPRR